MRKVENPQQSYFSILEQCERGEAKSMAFFYTWLLIYGEMKMKKKNENERYRTDPESNEQK